MDIQKIEKILELIEKTGFCEVEVEEDGLRVKVRKNIPASATKKAEERVIVETQASTKTMMEENDNRTIIRSPLVGTFHRSPSPEAPTFVELGDIVKKGQTLCIVEAMKLMNGVESEVEGKIVSIFIENAQPVEYGEPLFFRKARLGGF